MEDCQRMIVLEKPKQMCSIWRDTVHSLPQNLQLHVDFVDVSDASRGVPSWDGYQWLSSSYPYTPTAQASLAERIQSVRNGGRSQNAIRSAPSSPTDGDGDDESGRLPHDDRKRRVRSTNTPIEEAASLETPKEDDEATSCRPTLYCTTSDGVCVALHVINFRTWIHVRFATAKTKGEIEQWLEHFHSNTGHKVTLEIINQRPFFGVLPDKNDIYSPRKYDYYRFYLPSTARRVERQLLEQLKFIGGVPADHTQIRPKDRFQQLLNISTGKWINVQQWREPTEFVTTTQVEINCFWQDVSVLPADVSRSMSIPSRVNLSFDVEQFNHKNDDKMPNCDAEQDNIICINATVFCSNAFDGSGKSSSGDSSVDDMNDYIRIHFDEDNMIVTQGNIDLDVCANESLKSVLQRWNPNALSQDAFRQLPPIPQCVSSNAGANQLQHYCFFVDKLWKRLDGDRKIPIKVALPLPYQTQSEASPQQHLLLHIYPEEWMAMLGFRDLVISTCADNIITHNGEEYDWKALYARMNKSSPAVTAAPLDQPFANAAVTTFSPLLIEDATFKQGGLEKTEAGTFDRQIPKCLPMTSSLAHGANSRRHANAFPFLSKLMFEPCYLKQESNCYRPFFTFPNLIGRNHLDLRIIFQRQEEESHVQDRASSFSLSKLVGRYVSESACKMAYPIRQMNQDYPSGIYYASAMYCHFDALLNVALCVVGMTEESIDAGASLAFMNASDFVRKKSMGRFWPSLYVHAFQEQVIVDCEGANLPSPSSYKGATVLPVTPGLYSTPVLDFDFKSHYVAAMRDGNLCPSTLVLPFDDNLDALELPDSTKQFDAYQRVMKDFHLRVEKIYGSPSYPACFDRAKIADHRLLVPRSSQVTRFVNPNLNQQSYAAHSTGDVSPVCHFLHYDERMYMPPDWNDGGLETGQSLPPERIPSKSFATRGVLPKMLDGICNARDDTKRAMKAIKDNASLFDKTTSTWIDLVAKRKWSALNTVQEKMKLQGNCIYGSMVYVCSYVSVASTMATRTLLQFARHAILTRWRPSLSLYDELCDTYNASVAKGSNAFHGNNLRHFSEVRLFSKGKFPKFEEEAETLSSDSEPTLASIHPDRKLTSTWPIKVISGDTDAIQINLYSILPEGNEDASLLQHQKMDGRRIQLAFSIGAHIADFINGLFRSCNMPNVELERDRLMYPHFQAEGKKNWAAQVWTSVNSPLPEIVFTGIGKQSLHGSFNNSLVRRCTEMVLADLNGSRAYKCLDDSLSDMMNMCTSPRLSSQLAPFTKSECLKVGRYEKGMLPCHYIANEKLRKFSPGNEAQPGDAVKYVILDGPRDKDLQTRAFCLRHIELILEQQHQKSQAAANAGSIGSEGGGAAGARGNFGDDKSSSDLPVAFWDGNTERLLMLDFEYYVKSCESALNDLMQIIRTKSSPSAQQQVYTTSSKVLLPSPFEKAIFGWKSVKVRVTTMRQELRASQSRGASSSMLTASKGVPSIASFFASKK